ncbi:hypothetical protein ACP4OV_013985 [Aristida adscensionis]
MILAAAHVPPPCPGVQAPRLPCPGGHSRGVSRLRLLALPPHAVPRDDDAAAAAAATVSSAPRSGRAAAAAATATAAAADGLHRDYSHTLFRSEWVEVLGVVDLESLRRRPRLTVGVTVRASVVLPVMAVLAALYLADVTKGLVDWTRLHGDDAGD